MPWYWKNTLNEGTGHPSGLRKIADAPRPCLHPEHNPPGHIVLQPGTYEYTCPGCGHTVTFTVPAVAW